jgi:hypothetical protein
MWTIANHIGYTKKLKKTIVVIYILECLKSETMSKQRCLADHNVREHVGK